MRMFGNQKHINVVRYWFNDSDEKIERRIVYEKRI